MNREQRPFWRPAVAQEVEDEFGFHVEMRVREYMAQGLTAEQAKVKALQRFGDVAEVKSICRSIGGKREREMKRAAWWSEFGQDVRYALRQLRSAPAFTAVAVVTLGLGIGGTTTIFSAVDAVVLRPFPFEQPDRVMMVTERWRDFDGNVSVGNFVDWQEASRDVFTHLAAVDFANFNLADGDEPERVLGGTVTHEYFSVFGARPLHGRLFLPEEDRPGANRVVLLSEGMWQRRYGGVRSIVGSDIRIGGVPHTVVGIMPRDFDPLLGNEQLWVPSAFTPEQRAEHDEHYLNVVGLLKPGVTVATAQRRMETIMAELARLYPQDNSNRSATVAELGTFLVGNFRSRLFILLGAVGLVMLIACGNVANLLLARGAGRSKELAVRASLGAGRSRIVRQLLTENLVLSLFTSVAGIGLARFGIRTLMLNAPAGVPRIDQMRLDLRVIGFALLLGVLATLLFGLAPALRAARSDLQGTLREGGRQGGGLVRDRLRNALVIGEVAIALTLLVGAGLLIRSGRYLQRVDPGFEPDGVLTARVSLPEEAYGEASVVVATFTRIAEELAATPGVTAAAVTSQAPLGAGGGSNGLVAEGRPFTEANAVNTRLRMATPGIVEALGLRLVRGRFFDERDRAGALRVAVLSEAAARAMWGDEDPIGKRFVCCEGAPDDPRWKTVIGVVADVRSLGPTQAAIPEFYLPITQVPDVAWNWTQRSMTLVARGAGEPEALAGAMRTVLRRIDPTLPLHSVAPITEQLRNSTATERFNTLLLSLLGAVGLILAVIGIYSVIAYFVSLRTHEIGVRMALGATGRDVLRLLTLQGSRPVIAGLAAGTAGAFAATRVLRSSLYGVTPGDPITFVTVVALLGLAGLVAIVIPARRATRVDPARTLQS